MMSDHDKEKDEEDKVKDKEHKTKDKETSHHRSKHKNGDSNDDSTKKHESGDMPQLPPEITSTSVVEATEDANTKHKKHRKKDQDAEKDAKEKKEESEKENHEKKQEADAHSKDKEAADADNAVAEHRHSHKHHRSKSVMISPLETAPSANLTLQESAEWVSPVTIKEYPDIKSEIIGTEEAYLADLQLLTEHFLQPIRERKIMSDANISAIFSNVELLVGLNTELLSKIQSGDTKVMGESFLKLADFMKMYSIFCTNQDTSSAVIEKEMKKTTFRNFVQEAYKSPALHKLQLRDFMIKPIQRVCKYPLLLRELQKTTTQPDEVELLQKAYDKIQAVVLAINEYKKTDDNHSKIIEIQNLLETPGTPQVKIVTPTRIFLREAILKEWAPGIGFSDTHYFLFNDLLIRAKPTPMSMVLNKLTLKSSIPLDMCLVYALSDQTKISVGIPESCSFSWELCFVGHDKWIIVSQSKNDMDDWIQSIQSIVSKHLDHGVKKQRDHVFDAEEAFALGRAFTISSEDLPTEIREDDIKSAQDRLSKSAVTQSSPALIKSHSKKPPPPLPSTTFRTSRSGSVGASGLAEENPRDIIALLRKPKKKPLPEPKAPDPSMVRLRCDCNSNSRWVEVPRKVKMDDLVSQICQKFGVQSASISFGPQRQPLQTQDDVVSVISTPECPLRVQLFFKSKTTVM